MPKTTTKPQNRTETVTEVELAVIETMRLQVAELREQMRATEARLAEAEIDIVTRLKAGAEVVGRFRACIEERLGQCRPPWKEVHLEHMEVEHACARGLAEELIRGEYPAGVKEVLVIGAKP